MPADPPTSRLTSILDDDETRLKAKISKHRADHKAADDACDLDAALRAEQAMNRALDRLAALMPRAATS